MKIQIIKSLSTYRSILCLDGALPYDLIKKINLPIVAADGAANTLVRNGIEPAAIVGDLDSIDENILRGRFCLKIDDQDHTDFEKSLDFIEKKSLAPPIIMGIDGGYIDHMLENISIFSKTEFIALSNDIIFMIIKNDKILDLPLNTKISIFGMPECIIKSEGLKWELNNEKLSIFEKSSCGNRSICEQVKLNVSNGKAIIFIYTKIIRDAGFFS